MTDSGKGDSRDRPLVSADDVRRIAGPVDDVTVAEILEMGVSFGELDLPLVGGGANPVRERDDSRAVQFEHDAYGVDFDREPAFG